MNAMRNLKAPFLGLCLAFFIIVVVVSLSVPKAQSAPPETRRTPVVVELFTSEGCSSCPPADALLQKLQAQQPVAGAEIIALEEHVDYWNHDGWVDPYSSPDWTERQQVYVSLNRNDAYTPELVVDGRSQFVGNDEREARLEVEKAAHASKTEVSITTKAYTNGSQRFAVSIGKLEENNASDVAEVWLAVTEDGLTSSVSHGENSGRVLHHVATLRSLSKIGVADPHGTAVSFAGDPLVKIGPQWNVENLHVTVFVQNKKSRGILGAASTKIKG
jgi:hypothetical protein